MVNPDKVVGRHLIYFRNDPNKMKRGAGFYYKRSSGKHPFFRSKRAVGKNYFSKYNIVDDYLHKPNPHDNVTTKYKHLGGIKNRSMLTDNPKEAGVVIAEPKKIPALEKAVYKNKEPKKLLDNAVKQGLKENKNSNRYKSKPLTNKKKSTRYSIGKRVKTTYISPR